jgi:hypothetical protein
VGEISRVESGGGRGGWWHNFWEHPLSSVRVCHAVTKKTFGKEEPVTCQGIPDKGITFRLNRSGTDMHTTLSTLRLQVLWPILPFKPFPIRPKSTIGRKVNAITFRSSNRNYSSARNQHSHLRIQPGQLSPISCLHCSLRVPSRHLASTATPPNSSLHFFCTLRFSRLCHRNPYASCRTLASRSC